MLTSKTNLHFKRDYFKFYIFTLLVFCYLNISAQEQNKLEIRISKVEKRSTHEFKFQQKDSIVQFRKNQNRRFKTVNTICSPIFFQKETFDELDSILSHTKPFIPVEIRKKTAQYKIEIKYQSCQNQCEISKSIVFNYNIGDRDQILNQLVYAYREIKY
jgi:hypothetical protein